MKHHYRIITLLLGLIILVSVSKEHNHNLERLAEANSHKRIAFGILVHSEETFNGMVDLVDKLYSPEYCYIIHLDTKYNTTRELNYPNVHFVSLFNITWGSFNMTKSMIYLTHMAYKECKFDIFQFLDGSTYPLHPLNQIQQFYDNLEANVVFSATKNLKSGLTCAPGRMRKDPCKRTLSKCLNANCTLYSNTPRNQPIYKGMQWITLQYSFIEYMVMNSEWLGEWIQFFAPFRLNDELFFQTILMDAKQTQTQFYADIVQTIWGRCRTYQTLRSIKKWSPCYVGKREFSKISWDSLFIRKLYYNETIKSVIDEYGQIEELYPQSSPSSMYNRIK